MYRRKKNNFATVNFGAPRDLPLPFLIYHFWGKKKLFFEELFDKKWQTPFVVKSQRSPQPTNPVPGFPKKVIDHTVCLDKGEIWAREKRSTSFLSRTAQLAGNNVLCLMVGDKMKISQSE